MRLWTLHPEHLDPRGLAALWREGLLAQAVLKGETRGYRHHPQLARFRAEPAPVSFIAEYLRAVHAESVKRGYRFDGARIAPDTTSGRIEVTQGQIDFEWRRLMRKLEARAPKWHARQLEAATPLAHPLFRVRPGGLAEWERASFTPSEDPGANAPG